MKIYKYPLEITDRQTVKLPADSEIISIVNINEKPYIYVIVEPGEECGIHHEIICYGTGHPMRDDYCDYRFLGTLVFAGGRLVLHYFCRKL